MTRNTDEKVKSAYYQPKVFRRERTGERVIGRQGWPKQAIALSPWFFLLGTILGFLLACLLRLLGSSIFETGVELMRPVADLIFSMPS